MATSKTTNYANYLPDELLLEILSHFESWGRLERQIALARFSAVNRYGMVWLLYCFYELTR
jgi:hypothetical protein